MIKKIKEFLGLTYYTSKIDQFLLELNKKYHKPSASQQAEANKYARINKLRDKPSTESVTKNLWEKF